MGGPASLNNTAESTLFLWRRLPDRGGRGKGLIQDTSDSGDTSRQAEDDFNALEEINM